MSEISGLNYLIFTLFQVGAENTLEYRTLDKLSKLFCLFSPLHILFVKSIKNTRAVYVHILAQIVMFRSVHCVDHRMVGVFFLNHSQITC